MLLVMLVDDEGRAAERKTDAQIKVNYNFLIFLRVYVSNP